MRSCAPIAIEDCKEANGVTYCYCNAEGCNTPDRKLSNPHKPELGQAQAAARVSSDQTFNRYYDDEDLEEGSGQWGDFYYDDYNYIETNGHHGGAHTSGGHDIDDTEYGDGAHDDSDMTEPPPYLVEEPQPTHPKFDRPKVPESSSDSSDFTIIDDTAGEDRAKPSSAGRYLSSLPLLLLMFILMSEALVRM